MTKIKICGLKRQEDIDYVNLLKPDYVGFIFVKSSRQINKYQGKELIKNLHKNIKKVGVFLNNSKEEVKTIADYCELDILQFHGDEDNAYCQSFDYEIWKAFRIKDRDSLKALENYHVDGYLLDTYTEGSYGGTGKTFKWDIAKTIAKIKPIILAGGLTCENINSAIESVDPLVVDVSSGVETNGIKDFEKIKKIINNVRG